MNKKGYSKLIYLLLFFLFSCSTYIDNYNERKQVTNFYELEFNKDNNKFYYKSKVTASAGTKKYYPNNFKITLPKKMVYWDYSDQQFYFEFDSKQIIYINSGFKDNKQVVKELFTIECCSEEKIDSIFEWYVKRRSYSLNSLSNQSKKRVNRMYKYGEVEILLFNVKQENIENYIQFIKTFTLEE